jgi:hypothetical protein
MILCITATNIIDANRAVNKIWYNKIMMAASNTEKLVGNGINHYFLSKLENMTEEQVTSLKIYGKKQGVIQYDSGYTTSEIVEFKECDNIPGKYWSLKPDASLMSEVVNIAEEPFNFNWIPAWPPGVM